VLRHPTPTTPLKPLSDQTFAAPFTNYNSAGTRLISSYRDGGHAKVNEHFVRLTPDRQSKRGHLWSSRRVDAEDWSVALEFRVSGQGRTLFGDGLAFWFTDMPSIKQGDVFSVSGDFKGFAVIFDTFRNSEYAAVHKDISVLTGDGKPGAEDRLNTDRSGCNADFRYYEGADNFDVAKSISYAKITLKGRTLTVKIDPRADGKFQDCFVAQNVLPADFDITRGFFGLTGTTGGLADNHDVLALSAYHLDQPEDVEAPDPELHFSKQDPEKEATKLPAHETVGDPNYDPEAALRSLISTEKKITKAQVNDVKHYVEHSMSAVKDELKKIIGKVDKKVGGQEDHLKSIDDIIAKVKSSIANQISQDSLKYVEDRIDQLKKVMQQNIEQRLSDLEKKLNLQSESIDATLKRTAVKNEKHHATISDLKAKLEGAAAMGGGSSWVWAFGFLTIVVCGGFVFLYRKLSSSEFQNRGLLGFGGSPKKHAF
jgi:mannose-binding lectin 2